MFDNGSVRTGDVVGIDTDGSLFFRDRRTYMITTGGFTVSSQEGADPTAPPGSAARGRGGDCPMPTGLKLRPHLWSDNPAPP